MHVHGGWAGCSAYDGYERSEDDGAPCARSCGLGKKNMRLYCVALKASIRNNTHHFSYSTGKLSHMARAAIRGEGEVPPTSCLEGGISDIWSTVLVSTTHGKDFAE